MGNVIDLIDPKKQVSEILAIMREDTRMDTYGLRDEERLGIIILYRASEQELSRKEAGIYLNVYQGLLRSRQRRFRKAFEAVMEDLRRTRASRGDPTAWRARALRIKALTDASDYLGQMLGSEEKLTRIAAEAMDRIREANLRPR